MEAVSKDCMFSRAGKSSNEKYRILSQKESILARKMQFKLPDKKDFNSKTKLTYETINKLAIDETEKLKKVISTKSNAEKDQQVLLKEKGFIFNVQSRDDYYETLVFFIKRNKDKIPPTG